MTHQDQDAIRARTLGVVQAYLATLSAQDWDGFGRLWAEDGVLEFPYAPSGAVNRYVGREAVVRYMSGTTGRIAVKGASEVRFHSMLDPEHMIVELQIDGRALTTDRPYNQRYVTFFELQEGLIATYREYWSPLITMEAFGGYDAYMRDFYPDRGGST